MQISKELAAKLMTNFATDMLIFEDLLTRLQQEGEEQKENIQSVSEMIQYKKILSAELESAYLLSFRE